MDLNGTKGIPPTASTTLRCLRERQALSALTSRMPKCSAVACTSGTKYVVSFAAQPLMSTAVTIFVFTPHIRWHFTHARLSTSRPYFLLNQRT